MTGRIDNPYETFEYVSYGEVDLINEEINKYQSSKEQSEALKRHFAMKKKWN